jgi:23S rRNA pseudouridine2605 synthase
MAHFDRITPDTTEGSHAWFRVEMHEGRNREVRRLFEHQGFEVSKLNRIRYGTVELPRDLRGGSYQSLDLAAITALRQLVGIGTSTGAPVG